jgi:hypothetical protein
MQVKTVTALLLVLISLLAAAGCTQPEAPPATPVPTPEPTAMPTEATAEPTVISDTPGPTQTLPDYWSLDVQVQGNGEAIDPQIITTIRGGKGLNFILRVDVKVTRADGIVETGSIPRDKTYKVGDSVSLPVTSDMGNVNRVEVTAIDPQGNPVKIFDNYVPFRTYN